MLPKVLFLYVLGILLVDFYLGEGPFSVEGLRYEPEVVPAYTDSLRQSCARTLREAGLSEKSVSLSLGLLLGDKSQIGGETKSEIRQAGMSHLLAVSGLHIGILWMLLNCLCRPLSFFPLPRGVYPRWRLVYRFVNLFLLWVYILMIGTPVSAVRAGLMLSIVEVSWLAGSDTWSFNNLYSSAILILVFSPTQLYQPGFQLSFFAAAGILAFQPWLQGQPKVQQLVMVSLSAQAFTFPIVAYWFHQVPVLGWVQGVLVVPFIAVLVYLLLGLLVCTCLLPFLVPVLTFCVEVCVHWIMTMAHYISVAETWLLGGRLEWHPNLLEVVLMEAGAIFFVWLLRRTYVQKEAWEKISFQ